MSEPKNKTRQRKSKEEEKFYNSIADNIQKWRKEELELSQELFAINTGISHNIIRQREAHNTSYSIADIVKISEAFDVDIAFLLGFQGEKRKEIKDLKELTGLSEKACAILASCGKAISPKDDDTYRSVEQQRVEQNKLLSWLIENGFMQWLIAYNCTVNNWWKEHSYNPFDLEEAQKEIDKNELRTAFIQDDIRLIKADMYYLDRELSKLIHDGFVAIGRERENNEQEI